MPSPTNSALMKLRRRAEAGGDEAILVDTFVDVGPLFTLLSSEDHQVFYGRRGTGKTHALTYLGSRVESSGDFAALIDLRTVGSTGGLYADGGISLSQRGTRLLADVLGHLHDRLVDYALARAETDDVDQALALLDRFAEAITKVEVVGQTQAQTTLAQGDQADSALQLSATLGAAGPGVTAAARGGRITSRRTEMTTSVAGVAQYSVHFGEVSQVLRRLVEALPVGRVWVLLDEWAAVPMDLQPLLADLLRRALFPVPRMVVKIAAIEQRAHFSIDRGNRDYIGLEVGADAAADLDLDDYMVFGNDPDAAKAFFRELLFRHVRAQMIEEGVQPPADAAEFQRVAFTQRTAFDEFVRAAEGVPRDAINIVRMAAQRADDAPISVDHVRRAARRWYLTDKEKAVQANRDAAELLHWIVDTVIGERRARAFLLLQGERANHPLIADLYDARVLHVIKRGVSSRDQPGVRYDVYALDFGCYVELIATTRAPQGLYELTEQDGGGWVDVPVDDYRSIRHVILDLVAFEGRQPSMA